MDLPLAPPPPRDPQKRTRPAQLPPRARSRAALLMSAAAARGVFALQTCRSCGTVLYPPRDGCSNCLSVDLPFRPVADGGDLLAETTIRTSTDLYFRERTPWRVGTVRLDCGPSVMAHLHADVAAPARVRMVAKLDKSGHAVLMAMPTEPTPHMADDPQYRELTATARFRRVLVTDGRTAVGQAVAAALSRAGAAIVFVGIAEPWKPFDGRDALAAIPNVQLVTLDLTDTRSVEELAGTIGGKTDIIVNTADHVRPGGVLDRQGVVAARDEFETNVFGLVRLAQAFGPGLCGRGADGVNAAAAIVDVLSIHALSADPRFGGHSASAAARLSLLQCLRAEMRASGVRILCVFTGPVDDAWRQELPPPKVAPQQIARAVVEALEEGLEDSVVGDVARDVLARWRDDPKVLERELAP